MPPIRQPTTITAPRGAGIQSFSKNLIVEANTKLRSIASATGIKNELAILSVNRPDRIRMLVNARALSFSSWAVRESGEISGGALVGSAGSSTEVGRLWAFMAKSSPGENPDYQRVALKRFFDHIPTA